jgi:hypothetical protein
LKGEVNDNPQLPTSDLSDFLSGSWKFQIFDAQVKRYSIELNELEVCKSK